MKLPPLTALQFMTIEAIGPSIVSGNDIRKRLGIKRSLASFYQMMDRLNEAGFIGGSYSRKMVKNQAVRERLYFVNDKGRKAVDETRNFYK